MAHVSVWKTMQRLPEFSTDMPGYGLLSLRGRIENLLDREYSIIDTYTTPGMTALLTLRWDGTER